MAKYLNSINDTPIHRLYHISDIHIHCDKRHDEYKDIFQAFLDQLNPENTAVVITGNLLNTKNRITSNEIILARNFIFDVSQKCPIIIIPGNNDKHENIKAIISSGNISLQNINYLTTEGCYLLNNVLFTFVNSETVPKITEEYEHNIGIYHGVVEKCILYNGKHASSKKMTISKFKNCDNVLLGGISKTQFIDPGKKIAYAGSMMQRDYSEDWGDHGYMLWDLQTKETTHVPIYNHYRFVTLKIIDGKLMTPLDELPDNLYIKWDITESGSGMETIINQIQNEVRRKYNVEEETYVHSSFSPTIPVTSDNKYIFDLSVPKQKEYALSWHTAEGIILDEEEQKELGILIDNYNKRIKSKDLPYIQWKLLDIEFENILCYSEKQKIKFDNLKGVNGIIAQNNAGKSALFDILAFSLFGKSTRTDTYSYNDLVYTSDTEEKLNISCNLRIEDVITKDVYTIKREMNGKTIVVTIDKNGLVIHNGSTREGNAYIVSLLGTYDDFMTVTFMAQNNFHNFLMMTGKTQKEFTTRVFQLEIYDKFHKLSKGDVKKIKTKLKFLEEQINTINEDELKENIEKTSNLLLNHQSDKHDIEKQTNKTKQEKEKLLPTIEPLIRETCSKTLHQLKQSLVKNSNTIKIFQEDLKDLTKDWDDDEKEKNKLERQIDMSVEKTINKKEFHEKWKQIREMFSKLKEARGKKIKKDVIKPCSYDNGSAQISKNVKLAEEFISQFDTVKENVTEEQLECLKEEVFKLINDKPKETIYVTLERVKDKFKIMNNILDNLNTYLKNEQDTVTLLKKDLEKYESIPVDLTMEKCEENKEKAKEYELTLETIKQKLKTICFAKQQLQKHKYNPECEYCCNNEFVLDAKQKIKDEKQLLKTQQNLTDELTKLLELISQQKMLKTKLKIKDKITDHDKNIKDIQLAITEFNKLQMIKENTHKIEQEIECKHSQIKKMKKILKTTKSLKIVQEHLLILKSLQKQYDQIHCQILEDTKYNDRIEEKKKLLNKKLQKVNTYIETKNDIQNLLNSIKEIEDNIKIKESNIEITKKNNIVKKTLTLLTDLIENNNVKIINIIKQETKINYDLKKYKNDLVEYQENKDKYDDLQRKFTILNYFIAMTHHNGIPSYLLKKVTKLLQDNVNTILSEYSTMKVKIKNEGKETSIRIWNDKYKNGLNAKMLCGSEKFLVELAFRVAFQTLSNVSKPNFFICDEGWSCLDEKTRSNLDCILKTLLGYNDYILTVSHINDVRKWMNNHIKIVVEETGCRHISQ